MSIIQSDILILGSGVAGLSTAIKLAKALPNKKIIVATKNNKEESNTKYAQGGIAAVWDEKDSFESHIQDTLRAGDYLNDIEVVKMVVENAPIRLKELIECGAEFDFNTQNEYDLGKEGGHSANRILHHKDITGYEIQMTLIKQVENLSNIEFLAHHFAIELITEHHFTDKTIELGQNDIHCFGAYILNEKTSEIDTYLAHKVVLATGGSGQTYATTTNPIIATGDGVGMAFRAKAIIEDMQYIQFHPTALYEPGKSPAFLISEAVRGFGAYLRNKNGERFMLKMDDRGELASRDIVSRAINMEIYVKKDFIPILPAMHYMFGGITVNKKGQTSIHNLYANGEVAKTGLHGANRLASNSLLEALVFGHEIAQTIIADEAVFQATFPPIDRKSTRLNSIH